MIKLEKLELKNFLSHTDSEVDFSTLSGLVLVEGHSSDGRYESNGSGKSSILEGVVYALTGNTLRNVGVNDVVNRNVKKDTLSHLVLSTDTHSMDIKRYRADTKHGDSILLEIDGEDKSSRLNKQTQETIDSYINVPYRVLTNTILLGEGLSSRFTQLSDPDKKSLIESTLALSYDVNKLRDIAKSKVKVLQSRVSELNGSITSLTNVLEDPTEYESMEVYESRRSEILNTQQQLTSELTKVKEYLDSISTRMNTLTIAKNQYEDVISKIANIDAKVSQIDQSILRVESQECPSCTLCGQSLESEESKSRTLTHYKTEREDTLKERETLSTQVESLPSPDILNQKIGVLEQENMTYTSSYNQLLGQVQQCAQSLSAVESTMSLLSKREESQSKFKTQLELQKSEVKFVEKDIVDYEYIQNLFSPTGLITYILEEALSYINDRLSVYTEQLIDKSYQLKLQKGKLTLEDSSGASYQSLSNGEKRRLDVSIQFALHDYVHNYCGLKVSHLFIDEILDTLDAVGVDNIFQVLRMKIDYCKLSGVLVITHNDTLKSNFNTVLTVSKDKYGNSKIIS